MNWDFYSPYIHPVRSEPDDIDGLDHTNNAVYVRWCEQAAWAHSQALGLDLAAYRRLNRAMAIRQASYDYLLATGSGEALLLGTWLSSSDARTTLDRSFQLLRARDGLTVMRGQWRLVCIEFGSGKPRRMPPEFIAAYLPTVQL